MPTLLAEEQMEDLSGRRLGEYTLLEKIGFGGYGDVYRAEHRTLRKPACVKVMNGKRRHDDDAAQRFLREAQLASKLRHDNAAHIYDFGIESEDGLMWIAMELVDGVSLDKWIAAHGPMSLEDAAPLIEDVFDGVAAAHACEIVHRDLKPANLMVVLNTSQKSPGKYRAKLIDFGIAKGWPASLVEEYVPEPFKDNPGDRAATSRFGETLPGRKGSTETHSGVQPKPVKPHERQLTPTGKVFGTHAYMSPEQRLNAEKVSAAADIYSLGVVIIELLTGRRPSDETRSSKLLPRWRRRHWQAGPDQGLSDEIARVLKRALAPQPESRYASVRDLATDFRRAVQADPNEQLRSLTRQWETSGRSPDYLARGKTLTELCRSTQSQGVGEPQESFLAMSLRRARRARWTIGAVVALVVMSILLGRAEVRSRDAKQFSITSAIDRGRQALAEGNFSEAVQDFEYAYQRGVRSLELMFMFARALQPRLSEIARFPSSSGRMWSAMFMPDGKRVLTTDDKSAQMWDAVSGQLLFTMCHGETVYAAVLSSDRSKIITAGGDGTVRIWNAATGTPIRELRYQGSGSNKRRYYAVATSSHLVAAIDVTGKTVHVWNAETGVQIAELENDAAEMQLVAFSSDGHWLATSGSDEVRLFDTLTWRRAATITGPRVRSLSFNPNGPQLVVGTGDGVASIWEIPSGVLVRRLRGAGASVDAVAFSRDGVLVATASRDGMEQVWDVESGSLQTQLRSHHDMIYAVEFSTSSDLLLSAGADGAVVVSNVATGMPVARLEGPKNRVIVAHFDSGSRRVVGASWDGTARVWDSASPYRRWESPPIGAECDTIESLVPDQRFVAVSCRNHGTHVYDTARGEFLAELPSVSTVEGDYFSALPALTDIGDRAAIARGSMVEVYAMPSGQLLRTIVHSAAVNAVAFAPAGHDMVSGSVDGSLLLTQGEGEPIALPRASAGIDAVAILADGRVLAADASDRFRVIGPDHKALLMDVVAPSRVRLLRPSPDGRRLITLSTRSEMAPPALWDLDQRRLVTKLVGHIGRVFTARFVTSGAHEILTAGQDGTVRLWNAATGRLRRIFHGDSHSLADATFTPDGSVIVAGGSDGFLRFWDATNARLMWTLQAHSDYVVGVHYEGNELVTRGRTGDVVRWTFPPSGSVIKACKARDCSAPMEEK